MDGGGGEMTMTLRRLSSARFMTSSKLFYQVLGNVWILIIEFQGFLASSYQFDTDVACSLKLHPHLRDFTIYNSCACKF